MKPRISLNTFRRLNRAEEAMMRATMPRTAAVSEPLPAFAAPQPGEIVARRDGSRLVKCAFTLAEVAHA